MEIDTRSGYGRQAITTVSYSLSLTKQCCHVQFSFHIHNSLVVPKVCFVAGLFLQRKNDQALYLVVMYFRSLNLILSPPSHPPLPHPSPALETANPNLPHTLKICSFSTVEYFPVPGTENWSLHCSRSPWRIPTDPIYEIHSPLSVPPGELIWLPPGTWFCLLA
jgi:hypothetical protein